MVEAMSPTDGIDSRRGGVARRRGGRGAARGAASWPFATLVWLVSGALAGAAAEDDLVGASDERVVVRTTKVEMDIQINAMLGGDEGSVERSREKALVGAALEVELVDRICRLDEEQARTCRAAARIDAVGVAAEVERVLSRYRGRTLDLEDEADQRRWQQFHRDFNKVRGLAGSQAPRSDLLARVLDRTLDDRQRAAWKEERVRRTRRRWRIVVDRQIDQLQSDLGLTGAQARAIEAILLENPITFDFDRLNQRFGNANEMVGRVALTRADLKRLLATVDEPRRAQLEAYVRLGLGAEQLIESQGLVLE